MVSDIRLQTQAAVSSIQPTKHLSEHIGHRLLWLMYQAHQCADTHTACGVTTYAWINESRACSMTKEDGAYAFRSTAYAHASSHISCSSCCTSRLQAAVRTSISKHGIREIAAATCPRERLLESAAGVAGVPSANTPWINLITNKYS